MDYLGKEYSADVADSSSEQIETTLAYLRLINVPTMFDIGCGEADPSTDFLNLNMIDVETYKIEKLEFLDAKQKLKRNKIQKFRNALQAIHTNLYVSEVHIIPVGTQKNKGATVRQNEIQFTIDGIKYSEKASKIIVKRFKKDN